MNFSIAREKQTNKVYRDLVFMTFGVNECVLLVFLFSVSVVLSLTSKTVSKAIIYIMYRRARYFSQVFTHFMVKNMMLHTTQYKNK